MAEYTIKMADERGHVLEQIENGASEVEVRDRYSQQGFYVYSVKPKGLLTGDIRMPGKRKVRQDQFVIFNQQFVTLIHAGLPIIQAVELLIKRQRNLYFRSLLQNVRDRLRSGQALSEAFEAQSVFPKVYTTTLLAGETQRQPGRGDGPLHRLSAAGRHLPQKADLVAGVSHAAGGHADRDDDLPHHLRSAAVRQSLSPVGSATAADDRVHAFHRRECPSIRALHGADMRAWPGFSSGAG